MYVLKQVKTDFLQPFWEDLTSKLRQKFRKLEKFKKGIKYCQTYKANVLKIKENLLSQYIIISGTNCKNGQNFFSFGLGLSPISSGQERRNCRRNSQLDVGRCTETSGTSFN